MAAKPKLMSKVKQILLLDQQGKSKKWIAKSVGTSKNTVRKYLQLASINELSVTELLALSDPELECQLLPEAVTTRDERFDYLVANYDYLCSELRRTGVTRFLLWSEYRQQNAGGYSYSQFCFHLHELDKQQQTSAVINHQPGDLVYIDFAGKTLPYIDRSSGEIINAQVFLATLGYSQYSYIEALPSQKVVDFVSAMVRAWQFFEGVTQGVVPDNLKSAVTKSDRYEPEINKLLEDFANHYQTTIIPARVASPKDKSLVESAVNFAYRKIYAPLRNREFYSLEELNEAIAQQQQIFHQSCFQGKDYSRRELYLKEKSFLKPLPAYPFEIKKYRKSTVQKNSHIFLTEDKHYYSIPHCYIGSVADVVYSSAKVEVYIAMKLVAVHQRRFALHKYSTIKEHLPSHLQHYHDRSPQYYQNRAKHLGEEALEIISRILERKAHPEQAYKSCDGVLSLAKKTDKEVFMNACKLAIHTGQFNYQFMKRVIQNGMAKPIEEPVTLFSLPNHRNIRGKENYL